MTAAAAVRARNEWLESPLDHLEFLHPNQTGTILIRDGDTGDWAKLWPNKSNKASILAAQAGQPNRYISVNEFDGWIGAKLLTNIRACFVDIDGSQDLDQALAMLAAENLPTPSLAVFSGRGLHLYWRLQPTPKTRLRDFAACEDRLIRTLAPMGGDPKARDCSRILRLIGSVNAKSGTVVKGLVLDEHVWSFDDFCAKVIEPLTLAADVPEPKPKPKPKPEATAPKKPKVADLDIHRLKTGRAPARKGMGARWQLVLNDLEAIGKWHTEHGGGIPEGHRNTWLFLCAVALSRLHTPPDLKSRLRSLARAHTTLDDAEAEATGNTSLKRLEDSMEQGEDLRYQFKRETLFTLLKKIIPDDLAPKLRAIASDETKARHKKEQEANRDRVKEGRYKVTRDEYRASSLSTLKPWEALGISRATYYRRKEKEHGTAVDERTSEEGMGVAGADGGPGSRQEGAGELFGRSAPLPPQRSEKARPKASCGLGRRTARAG